MDLLKEIGVSGFLDIAIVSLLIYAILVFVKRTRAPFIATGIVIIALFFLLARQFNLDLTYSIIKGFFALVLVSLIVIFRDEIRQLFEEIALWSIRQHGFRRESDSALGSTQTETLVRTLIDLSKQRIGAIIVIRGKRPLERHLHGGVDLEGQVSEPILKSIFDPHSVGHDGAVVIADGRIKKFATHLPLSTNYELLKNLGTRHAAALGISERTDALSLVASEERGTISVARHGDIREVGQEQLNLVLNKFHEETAPVKDKGIKWTDLIMKNYREKLLTVLIALTLWFVFVHESRFVFQSFSVPVEFAPLPSEYQITEVEPTEVRVTLLGPRRGFYFMSEREIGVLVKVPVLKAGKQTVKIPESGLSYPAEVSLEGIEPREVEVNIEKTRKM